MKKNEIQINPLSSNDQLIFIHIPKSAGTSVQNALCNCINLKYCVLLRDDIKSKEKFNEKINSFQAISGHFSFNNINTKLTNQKKHIFITLLRNPLERILSLYHYIKITPQHYLNPILFNEQINIYTFLNKLLDYESIDLQKNSPSDLQKNSPSEIRNTSYQMLVTPGLTSQDSIKFIENNYHLVGITEMIGIAEEKLNVLLSNFTTPFKLKKINVTERKELINLDSKTLNFIHDINQIDFEIYEYFFKNQQKELEENSENLS